MSENEETVPTPSPDNPAEREKEFMDQRLTGTQPGPAEEGAPEEAEHGLPPDFRKHLVEEYRTRESEGHGDD